MLQHNNICEHQTRKDLTYRVTRTKLTLKNT